MKYKRYIRKFHRWIGLIAAIWLLVLSTTGFLLQHSTQWKLDKSYITSPLILKMYGIGEQFIAFKHDQHEILQIDKQFIQNNKVILKFDNPIKSAIYLQSNWIILTDQNISWINQEGQIIQTMDELDGLPETMQKLGIIGETVYVLTNQEAFNISTLSLSNITVEKINWAEPIHDKNLKNIALKLVSKNYLTIEQLLFDLHAGLIAPSLINDMAAISLIILSFSGIFLFFRKKKTNHHNRRK